jgi:DNA-directed RNA polymerase specialized sigma24 family protein
MGISEAMRLGLLAPARAWVAEVDVDASTVRLVGGDYEPEALGALMSAAPFFKATELFRYDSANAALPALLCCSTRRQAAELVSYLHRHRPTGSPAPELVLGETPKGERERILARFERGEVDTLVQVGVLTEGWSSPRCKLLVDLSPSRSRVRATQKYFRVMTPHEGREARLFVLLPRDLLELPVLPPDLLGAHFAGYQAGTLLGSSRPGNTAKPACVATTRIAGVELKQRVLLSCPLEPPTLRRGDRPTLRAVLRSCEGFDPSWGLHRFRRALFRHPEFSGSGAFLLAHLGVRGFDAWMGSLYPRHVADRLLAEAPSADEAAPAPDDGWQDDAHAALVASGLEPPPTPEELLLQADDARLLDERVGELKPRHRLVLTLRFGLAGGDAHSLEEVGARLGVSRERVRGIESLALVRLRELWRRATLMDPRLYVDWLLRIRPDSEPPPAASLPQGAVARAVWSAVARLESTLRDTGRTPSPGALEHLLARLRPATARHVERWARARLTQLSHGAPQAPSCPESSGQVPRPRTRHEWLHEHRILSVTAALLAARRGVPVELLGMLRKDLLRGGPQRAYHRWVRRLGRDATSHEPPPEGRDVCVGR